MSEHGDGTEGRCDEWSYIKPKAYTQSQSFNFVWYFVILQFFSHSLFNCALWVTPAVKHDRHYYSIVYEKIEV